MKIIDLLNKIANGEEVPGHIKTGKNEWYFDKSRNTYDDKKSAWIVWDWYVEENRLNDEVEILEEEKKMPEKLEEPRFNKGRYYIKDINGDDSEISGIERTFRLKINEIIDCLDYLKSKGE